MVPENVVGLIGCCLTAVLYYSGSVSKPLLRGLWFYRIVYSCLCFGQRGLCILLQNKSRTQLISLFVQIVWFFGESKGKFTHIEFTSAMPLFIFFKTFPFFVFFYENVDLADLFEEFLVYMFHTCVMQCGTWTGLVWVEIRVVHFIWYFRRLKWWIYHCLSEKMHTHKTIVSAVWWGLFNVAKWSDVVIFLLVLYTHMYDFIVSRTCDCFN